MKKINREEYEILKGLEDIWKWIARDNKGFGTKLKVHTSRPGKMIDSHWSSGDIMLQLLEREGLFKFVQWKDSEPWNIQELIEEYEKEREETEMKKDIEWVKNKIDLEVIRRIGREDPHFYVNVGLKMALDFLKQLDEPEVLSQEISEENGMSESEWAEVIDRYKWHLEQEGYVVIEKPAIPHFIFDWIEECEGVNILEEINYLEISLTSQNRREEHEIYFWLKNNFDTFARAWLDGFTVEEEPKYFAKIKGHENIGSDDKYWSYCITDENLEIGGSKVHADVLAEYVLSATKDEWENLGINDDNADFVEVEELEE